MASGGAESVPGAAALSADSWRLLIEAEIDTIVRELRKNALWAEAVERDGLGALWVGGGRWPGAQPPGAGWSRPAEAAAAPGGDSAPSTPGQPQTRVSRVERYRQEFASRRTLGRAGQCIGMASFADKGDDMDSSDYEVGRMVILESFLLLREAVNGVADPRAVGLQAIIDPFLLVIRDPETAGPITRCALVSIQRFISHGVVDLARGDAVGALLDMTQAVTHCRFEATDAASDEVVLMQILNVLGALVLSAGGSDLNDVAVCEIMETVLSMSCQMRVSEMLRKAAESTLFTLVTFVFGRLGDLQREAGGAPATPARFGLPAIRELYRVLVALANPRDLQYTDTMRLLALNTLQSAFQRACYTMAEFPALRELTLGDLSHSLLLILQRDQPALIAPALRVLYLLFASHRRYTKGHLELFLCQTLGRIMALPAVARQGPRRPPRLGGGSGSGQSTPRAGGPQPAAGQDAAAGLGIGGPAEKAAGRAGGSRRPSVASVYGHSESDVVRCVLPPLLESECALTYEQEVELYGDASLRAGTRGRLATLETRRQLVEGLHHLLIGDESLITDLWVNYDCDMQSGDMFDYVTAFVAHRAVPWPDAPGDGEDEAFRDIMLYHLVRIAGRAGVAPPAGKWAQLLGLPAAAAAAAEPAAASPAPVAGGAAPGQRLTLVQLKDRKRHKDTMMRAARMFNEKPKEGIAYLQRVGMLTPDNSSEMAQQLAAFLHEAPTLNKKLLGEYLSKPSNLEVLQAYLQLFDFSGRRLDEALRRLLGTFRLPGESQQIERIMETFAAAYYASGPPDVATTDAAFILAFAIIMLNTDQHSPQVKSRMGLDDFARNLRGVNDGQNFPPAFVEDIYDAIRTHEIVFPQEHEGDAGFEYAWREIAAPDAPVGPWTSTRGQTAAYDRELLAATWPRFLRSLARTLAHFGSDHTLRQALSGLYALVGSAAHYGLTACVDEAVVLLADMAGLGRGAVLGDLLAPQVLTKAYGRYAVLDPESPTSALGAAAEGFAGAEQRAKLQEQEQASVQVTQAALEFGSEYRAQIAFVALFELATRFADAVSGKGWAAVLDVVRVAVDADLVPHELRQIADPAAVGMWIPRIPTLQAMDAAQLRIRARQLGARNGQLQGAPGSGGLLMAISSLWGGGGSGDGQMSPGRRLELRWRAAPELLVGVVARGRLAVQASAIGELGAAVGRLDQSLPAFLAELARLFPQSPPSQPETPADGAASGAGGMVQDAAMPADEARPGAGAGPSAHYTPSSVFCLELAVALVLDAPARAGVAWPPIEAAVQRILEYTDDLHHYALERAVGGTLRMAARVLESCGDADGAADAGPQRDIAERMLRCLGLLRDATDETFGAVAPVLAEGIGRLVDADARALFSVPANWGIIRLLLKRLARAHDYSDGPAGARRSLAILVEIVILLKCGAVDPAPCFDGLLDVLAAFAPSDRALALPRKAASGGDGPSHLSGLEAASKLIALLFDMQGVARSLAASAAPGAARSPSLAGSPKVAAALLAGPAAQTETSAGSLASGAPSSQRHGTRGAPLAMWTGAMAALCGYACSSSREVRQLACAHVQRAVASAAFDSVEWVLAVFTRVLLPLMDALLRADMLADSTMEDTHARCISMLTMVFLHNASTLHGALADADGPSRSPRLGLRHSHVLADGGAEPAADEAGRHAPLGLIWLRLVGTLSVYIRTAMVASEPQADRQPAGATSKHHGIPLDEDRQAAERRRHLSVLGEMAGESIKNSMLVLDSMGIFGPADERETNAIWCATWERLDRVDPRLRDHIFPPPPPQVTGDPPQPHVAIDQPQPPAAAEDPQQTAGENHADAPITDNGVAADEERPGAGADHVVPGSPELPADGAGAQQPVAVPPQGSKKKKKKQSIIVVSPGAPIDAS